jgi:hypothetical protein
MTHDQLVRVFPNGRTVHVPSDGRPLPGYELALADVQRRGATPSAVSFASARDSGVIANDTAQAADKPKRNLLAKLFGFGNDTDDEDANETQSRGRKLAVATRGKFVEESEPAKPIVLASAIPLPRVRPLAREPKPELGAFNLTAAASPAEIVRSRGLWTARDLVAADNPAPLPSRNERLVWQTGPHGRTAGAQSASASRPRPGIELVSASPETTASVPWPEGLREDKIPSDLVLAYAAQGTAPQAAPRPVPMGALRTNQTVVPRGPVLGRTALAQPRAPARLLDNPWLRGVMLSPSITDAMGVGTTSTTNYRELARFLYKPAAALALGFADDSGADVGVQRFSGKAIAFLPTIRFGGTVTARLN